MTRPILPSDSTVSLTLSGIPAELYLRLLVDAGRAGRGLRAEVLHRLRTPARPVGAFDEAEDALAEPAVSLPGGARS